VASEDEFPSTLLRAWRAGDLESGNRLFSLAYTQLRRLAAARLRREAPNHVLQPTALVHELYLRLFASEPVQFADRAHFMAVAADNLRRILIDHARAARRIRRGGAQVQVTLSEALPVDAECQGLAADVMALEDALQRLESIDPRVSRVVELRFLAGLTEKEAAEVLGVSVATLKRDWTFGRAWLLKQLSR
jgi:RNA polymerase sigma factor (TIGR02999 family)